MRGSLPRRMQRFQKCDDSGCLRRTQIFSVSRHVAAPLDHLPDELILREPHRNAVQGGAPLAAALSKRMAVAALLDLEDERALPLESRRAVEHSFGHRISAPCVHVRTPERVFRKMSKGPQRDRDQQHGQNSNRPAPPALLTVLLIAITL